MADNIAVTPGTGATMATDDASGVHHPYAKVEFGADGTQTPVSATNPMPVGGSGAAALGKAEDAAHTTGDVGVPILGVVKPTVVGTTSTTDDYGMVTLDATGRLKNRYQPAAADGMATARVLSATATGTTTLTAAATLFNLRAHNTNAAIRYLKLYDKATAADQNDTPIDTIALPANGLPVNIQYPQGLKLTNGLSVRSVTEVADNGTTGATANETGCSITYV